MTEATAAQLDAVRELFTEYVTSVNEPCCFADFDRELADLPGEYVGPRGSLLLLEEAGQPAGCVALRPLAADRAEVKRLYVRPAFRGRGHGRALGEAVIDAARRRGYRRLMLDTLPTMAEAMALYRSLGFTETLPYLERPTPGAYCFQLSL